MSLKKFENNIQSQFGEDGVIDEIFNRINPDNKICVEFGAWDGVHLSNSWNLWHNKGWSSYLIEGDAEKAKVLENTISAFPKVKAINAYVMPEGENCLDQLLSKYNLPKDFDLLSIDIDGDDYYIFEHLNNYRPKVIVIEYNPTVPPTVEMVQERGQYMGASALSIIKLGEIKGYVPIHITTVNVFFVSVEVFNLGHFEVLDLTTSFNYDFLVSVITSYDGIPFLSSKLPYKNELPWLPEMPIITLKAYLKSFLYKSKTVKIKLPLFKSKTPFIPVNIYSKK